jgi:peptide/nickel transport system substrate-binding protein
MLQISARLMCTAALCLAASACAPAPQPTGGAEDERRGEPARGSARKAFVMATTTEPAHLGGFQVVGTGYQGPIYQMVHDFPHPHLAEALPSMEAGTWTISPDGTMETVWRLRAGAKWHDGTPFSAQDIAFTWQVANNSDIPWSRPAYARRIAEITTPDASTLVMRWKGRRSIPSQPTSSRRTTRATSRPLSTRRTGHASLSD